MPGRRLRIGVLAGEASGDILGSRILAELRRHCDDLVVEGIGGPLMEAQGLHSLFPMERLSVMGFVEPLKRLPELLRIRSAVYQHFRDDPPDLFLGIDSPDFNLRLERKLRGHGIRTAHLVSPSVWAWRRGRIHKIKRAVDLMLCLFPFETAIYDEHGIPVRFVGHPLADELPEQVDKLAARRQLALAEQGKLLALLPGSRGGEVRLLAPLFLAAAQLLCQRNPGLRLVLPAANPARRAELEALLARMPTLSVTLLDGRSREAMAAADAVLLASGTATLEAALLRRPMVVGYRMGAFSWWLITRLVNTEYAALPNVLAGRALVPELLQEKATPAGLADAVQALLDGGDATRAQLAGFADMHRSLSRGFARQATQALLELSGG